MINEFEQIHYKLIKHLSETLKTNQTLRRDFERVKMEYESYKVMDKPGFFSRLFKPSMMKDYTNDLVNYAQLKNSYEEQKQIIDQLPNDDELTDKIEEIKQYLSEARNNIRIVIDYYIKNNIPIVLTKKDKEEQVARIKASYDKNSFDLDSKDRRIKSLEDIMLVHKTNFIPKNGEIGTRQSSNVMNETDVTIAGNQYEINIRPTRNTVHFSVNHEVVANNGGNWDSCKYAVIVPLLSIPKEQFGSNNCVDTFTNGKVLLGEGTFILCPQNEMEKVQQQNPNVIVIGYEGESVLDYANSLLWMLGYSVEIGNDWGFEDVQRQNEYSKIIKDAGYKSTTHHTHTKEKEIERQLFYINYVIGVLELVINNPIFQEIDTNTIIMDGKIRDYLYFYNKDTEAWFNKCLGELGIDVKYPERINCEEDFINYCALLVETAKNLGKNQSKKI